LEGIKRIMELENQVAALQFKVAELTEELSRRRSPLEARIFAAGAGGDVVSLARGQRPRPRSQAVVVWRPRPGDKRR
jgi:MerR family transcriptional regulator/heat shock protein HspR